jgi:hypothetical protein
MDCEVSEVRVIGYSFNADHYCEKCMLDYAREVPFSEYDWQDFEEDDIANDGLIDLSRAVELEIIKDSEGNPIHPIFGTDEWYNIGEGNQTLCCNVCSEELDTYEEVTT